MSRPVICVDFGASRIKAVALSSQNWELLKEISVAAPKVRFGSDGEVEADPISYWKALEETAGSLLLEYPEARDLWLCSEMHGFALADSAGNLISKYISWRDARAMRPFNGCSTSDLFKGRAHRFLQLTGMQLRAGLPLLTLTDIARRKQLPVGLRVCTLTDMLLLLGGETQPRSHASLSAGTGFFNIWEKCWSRELAGMTACADRLVPTPFIDDARCVMGTITLCNMPISVRGCVGDLPAVLLSASSLIGDNFLINLGTGSQVVWQKPSIVRESEFRIDALGSVFGVISHIASGRALSVIGGMIDEAAVLGGGKPVFWDIFATLESTEVLEAPVSVDMHVFPSAWEYLDGGAIVGIHEDGFGLRALIAGTARGWLGQYVRAINLLDPFRTKTQVYISGGLSRRAGFLAEVLAKLSQRAIHVVIPKAGEETIEGLITLARAASA